MLGNIAKMLAVAAVSLGAFGLLVVGYARNVYGAYLASGVVDLLTVLLLLRYLAAEFLLCGLVAALVWGRKSASRVAALLLVGLFTALQFTQYQTMVSADEFLTTDMLQMVGAYEYGATPEVIGLFARWLVLSGLLSFSALRLLRICQLRRADRLWGGVLVAGLALVLVMAPRGWRESTAERRHGLVVGSPTVSMVDAWAGFLQGGPAPMVELDAADLELARSYGLPLDPEAAPPLRRESFSTGPLPFALRADIEQPNVILLLLESLTATLLEPHGGTQPGLTPNLQAMAQNSMRVDEYFNHTTPTIRGIAGQLCSTFPYYSHEDWEESDEKLRRSKLLCMAHVLAEQGYHTASLTYMTPDETHIETQLVDFGFQELFFRHRLMSELAGPPHDTEAFPTDERMFRALMAYLERWQGEQPLFLTLTTVGTHTGWDAREGEATFGDGSNRVLNTFHNLDRQFGMFWEWFKASPYFDNTVLVVTGDHAIYPHDAVRQVAAAGYTNRTLARMGLFIHDPAHHLPPVFEARTSSIDLAPSLLHLIGAADRENPFVGVSMFSDRGDLRGGPGRAGDHVLLWEDGAPQVVTARSCDGEDRQEHACRLHRLIQYLEWLEQSNRVWRD